MKPMTARQAQTCENSATLRCRCRCMGSCHGSGRSLLAEFFEQLPESDPHRTPEKSRQMPLPKPVGA